MVNKQVSRKLRQQVPQGEGELNLQHELKSQAYQNNLKRVRSRLSPSQRSFSHFAHSRLIDNLTSFISMTVARPGSLLSGSIFALLGSVTTVYFSKHYGYPYNYFLIVYIFVAGYVVGLVLELIIRSLKKSK